MTSSTGCLQWSAALPPRRGWSGGAVDKETAVSAEGEWEGE